MERFKSRKSKVILGVVGLLLVAVLLWRYIPRSYESVIPWEQDAIGRIDGRTSAYDPRAEYGGHGYCLQLSKGSQWYEKCMELLQNASYRPSFHNLPFFGSSYTTADEEITLVGMTFFPERELTQTDGIIKEYGKIQFFGKNRICISSQDEAGFPSGTKMYYINDETIYEQLHEWILTYGEEKY